MLPTVDGGEDDRLRVEVVPGQLAAVRQLKDALTDFHRRPVHLVQEQDAGLVAALCEPVGRAKGSRPAIGGRQTEKVALGHLRGAPLNDGHPQGRGGLVDHAGLTNAVTATKQNGLLDGDDVRGDVDEGCEIDGHVVCPCSFVP